MKTSERLMELKEKIANVLSNETFRVQAPTPESMADAILALPEIKTALGGEAAWRESANRVLGAADTILLDECAALKAERDQLKAAAEATAKRLEEAIDILRSIYNANYEGEAFDDLADFMEAVEQVKKA